MSVNDGSPRTPWWASGDDPTQEPTEDPLTAHRQARRGETGHVGERDAGSGEDRAEPGPTPPPWWDGAVTGLARVVEQLSEGARAQAVANARGGGDPRDATGGEGGRARPGPASSQERGDTDHSGHEHDDDAVCQICPICAALRTVGEHRPELLGHLAEAARSLSLAARTVLDGHADGSGRSRGDDRFEHVDVQ